MSYDVIQFVADQLQAAAPEAEWDAAGHDRARELAAMLIRAGVRDLSKLSLLLVKRTKQDHAWTEPYEDQQLTFSYEGRRIGYLGTPERNDNKEFLEPSDVGFMVAWSAAGKGHVNYVVTPKPGGFAIVPLWGSSSDAGHIRQALIFTASMVVGFALPAAGINAASAIGSAVVPSTVAAAYPGLTTAIGNVALATALNGGNIEAAAKNAAISYVSGVAGAQAMQASDAVLIGKVTAAATRAFLAGADVEKAVLQTLIANGADAMEFFDFTSNPAVASPVYLESMPAPAGDAWGGGGFLDPWSLSPTVSAGWGGGLTFDAIASSGYAAPNLWDNPTISAPIADRGDPFGLNDFREVVNTVAATALTALKVHMAYKQVNNPQPVVVQARAVSADGSVATALDTGIIQVRHPDGRIERRMPPVNVPQSTVTGNIIVNNGDGTYTLISAAGQRSTHPYSAGQVTSSQPITVPGAAGLLGGINPALLLAGGAAVLLLMSRRGR